MASDILIVDDEADIRELVAGILQDEGHATRTARDSDEALSAVVARRPNLVFLDIWLKGSRLDGLQLLDSLKQQHPELPIVMISGHGNNETAVSTIKRGAYDFIEKPFKADRLLLVAERALENSRLTPSFRNVSRNPPRLIAVFATYASPTIATSFGRYRKPLHQRTVATIGSPTARPTANQSVQLSHRSL